MNAAIGTYGDEMEASYAVDFGRDREPTTKRSRHPDYRRKGSAPARVNGMHCRRNKRWTWGSGRGARMMNMRAFAGCLAVALASVSAAAFGGVLDTTTFSTINNVGNAGNGSSSPANLGSVSSVYRMATTEVTNAQYVQFLNAMDPNGTNPRGIYNTASGTSGFGGILLNGTAAPGSRYAVKTTPATGGNSYASMPVNFVNWFSAARFVNWLNNGEQSVLVSGTGAVNSMETGAYVLSGSTSGNLPARSAGAQVFLPSQNEWYKAAFYNGPGAFYTGFQTNTNATPFATGTVFTTANSANYATPPTGFPINVGSFTNQSTSAYGLFDMLGNVAELTDNTGVATSASYRAFGGGWGGAATAWNASAAAVNQLGTFTNASYGFRIAAVPEPGTIALAGVGIAGLFGLDWMKRRKKRTAAARHLA